MHLFEIAVFKYRYVPTKGSLDQAEVHETHE